MQSARTFACDLCPLTFFLCHTHTLCRKAFLLHITKHHVKRIMRELCGYFHFVSHGASFQETNSHAIANRGISFSISIFATLMSLHIQHIGKRPFGIICFILSCKQYEKEQRDVCSNVVGKKLLSASGKSVTSYTFKV